MKALIVRNAFSYDFGGAERLAVHIAKELELNSVDTVVLSRQPRLLAYAESQGVKAHKAWWWNHQNWSGLWVLALPVYLLWQALLFLRYIFVLIRIGPDIVHLMGKDDFIAGTLAAKLLRKGVVWTDPADLKHIFRNNQVWYKNPVGKLVYQVAKRADAITLVSESELRLIAESVGHTLPMSFVVMHLAGKDETVQPKGRAADEKDAVIFCSTSRLVEAKGIGDLIEAFAQLSKASDAFRLWLVGNGPDEERFIRQAAGNNYIRFIGHSDIPLQYVAESDVFIHPTHHEGFSLSLAEAAMLGKPMIATDVGGNPELVRPENGMLVPAHDVTALRSAMLRLGTDVTLRAQMGVTARHDYVIKFDFSTIIKTRLLPIYEKIS